MMFLLSLQREKALFHIINLGFIACHYPLYKQSKAMVCRQTIQHFSGAPSHRQPHVAATRQRDP